jgi:pimeloyl-ACP methyl ester carboxylesterase
VWDGIIVKLRLDTGEVVATDQWGNSGIDGYGAITLDDAGHLYVSGAGSPPGAQPDATGAGDPFFVLAKHSAATLENVWRRIDPVLETSEFVAEAWSGVTYVPGQTPGTGQILTGGWFRNPPGGADGFLALYGDVEAADPVRDATFVVRSEGLRADWILDHAVGPDGSVYAVGATTGGLDGAPQGDGDAFIVRLDAQLGSPTFVQLGSTGADLLSEIDVAADGTVTVVGYSYGDLAGANLDASGRTGDVVVMRFDADLGQLAATRVGSVGEERAGIAVTDDRVIVGGMTEGSLVSPSHGAFDAFAVALDRTSLDVAEVDVPSAPSTDASRETAVGPVASTPPDAFVGIDFHEPEYVTVSPGPVEMAYVDVGPRDGPVVLLLHGNPAWSYYYRDVIDGLVEQGYRVVAPDLIGFGRSDKPVDRSAHTYEHHIAWVTDFVEQLDLTDVTLHAHDWGGLIGMRVVPLVPERFAAVGLANTGLPTGGAVPPGFAAWQRNAQTIPQFSAVIDRGSTRVLTTEELAAFDAPWPLAELTAGPREMPLHVPFDDDPQGAINATVLAEFWAAWDRPFAIMFSEERAGTPGVDPQEYAALVPGTIEGQPQYVTDTGHYLHIDAADLVVEQIVTLSGLAA